MTLEEPPIEPDHIQVAHVAPTHSRSCGSVFMLFNRSRLGSRMKTGVSPYDENEPEKKPVDKKKVNKMKRLFGF